MNPEHIEALSHIIDHDAGPYYPAFRLQMDCMGYDGADDALFDQAFKAAIKVRRDRRFLHGVLGRFTSLMMSNAMIGAELELPKSTVQAIACGRLPERFTAKQRATLAGIFREHIKELQGCLDDLV